MALSINALSLLPTGETRKLLIKWVVALLVPVIVFTLWTGEGIINAVISPSTAPQAVATDSASLVQSAIFIAVFYLVAVAFAGYLIATDSGRRGMVEVWLDVVIFAVVPLLLMQPLGLIIGLAVSALVWAVYFYLRKLIRSRLSRPALASDIAAASLATIEVQQSQLVQRAILGGFWFAASLDVVWLVLDLVYFFIGQLSIAILIWVAVRTLLLPVLGYLLGRFAGLFAVRMALGAQNRKVNGATNTNGSIGRPNGKKQRNGAGLSDLPLRSKGAQRFMLTLLLAFVLFYPVIDPFLFGSGTDGRLAGYGDAGYYVILALGLNIVVGFAGLLDLGYVAFFAIGAYTWAMVGSHQLTSVIGIPTNLQIESWLFWPMLIVTALIAAFWGVVLGAPTLRLRGDYLAIVTLGFGEIVPIVFLELDKYTNGANGIVGIQPPAFPGADWTTSTPYYYLILALIVLVIFANIRLRDSRLGRAWIAIREDEIAAASSGVNLVNTKLFAFAAGAFFSGLAGAYHAAKLGSITPDSFSFGDSVIYLAMVVIGGIGSIPGVIVGALVVYSINEFILTQLDTLAANPNSFIHPLYAAITSVIPGFTFGNIRNLIFGVVLVIIMIFRPEGLIPSARRRRELHGVAEAEPVEIGSLDVSPGTPEFESEVRVE